MARPAVDRLLERRAALRRAAPGADEPLRGDVVAHDVADACWIALRAVQPHGRARRAILAGLDEPEVGQ